MNIIGYWLCFIGGLLCLLQTNIRVGSWMVMVGCGCVALKWIVIALLDWMLRERDRMPED